MANLFMTVAEALTPSLRGLIAEALNETPENVERGARRLAGGVVTGLIATARSPAGATEVLQAVRRMDVGLLFDASPLLDTDWRAGEGASLLGDRAAALSDAAAANAAIRPQSARALLELVEPLVLAAVARSGVASDEAGLRSFFRSIEAEAMRLAPASSGRPAPSVGAGAPEPAPQMLVGQDPLTPQPRDHAAARRRAMWLALLLLVALVLLFTVGRG